MQSNVIPINIHAGFDEFGQWHQPTPVEVESERFERSHPLRPAQGIILGIVISSAAWVVLILAGVALYLYITSIG